MGERTRSIPVFGNFKPNAKLVTSKEIIVFCKNGPLTRIVHFIRLGAISGWLLSLVVFIMFMRLFGVFALFLLFILSIFVFFLLVLILLTHDV